MNKNKKILIFAIIVVVIFGLIFAFLIFNKQDVVKNIPESDDSGEEQQQGEEIGETPDLPNEEELTDQEDEDDVFFAMYGQNVDKTLSQGLDPSKDDDGDGLSNLQEVENFGTDPLNPDTDDDGLNDKLEIELGTDPLNPDTDGDEYSDGDEVKNGYNPLGEGKLDEEIWQYILDEIEK